MDGWFATGVNNLPLNYIKERDIILTNGKGIQAKQVSEYIMHSFCDYKKMKTSYRNQLEKIMTPELLVKEIKRRDFYYSWELVQIAKGCLFSQSFWNESNRG